MSIPLMVESFQHGARKLNSVYQTCISPLLSKTVSPFIYFAYFTTCNTGRLISLPFKFNKASGVNYSATEVL